MFRETQGGRGRGSWAVVVGSAGGAGREIALRLAEDGYSVVVCGRDGASARETRQLIEWVGGRAVDVVADLADSAAVDRLVIEVFRLLVGEPLEVLVNVAGEADYGLPEDAFDTAFDLIVKTPFLLTGAFAPVMAERGRGAVVNVGGLDGMAGLGNAVRAAVAALDSLIRLWAAEYGPRGVRINSVDLDGGGESDAIAEAVRFLVSPHAAYVQGSVSTMS
ncbi:SDR family NAD(P)-dependent oxidoreductase [Nocardia pseudobrasiliensis]|uniref:3-oxoacyl-[acyl-carrier-protein] reductase MabA n=1 Tax=Nocardia pseudobrasiliensis TaxID=45979 RepID=A0A370IBV5_9NOCA|nr:SDR family oxidoreductase [Nocardia pseudobrasiliensis]RDI68212.1 short subunit dehydrogenase [Nocardia pseudobrasiliensis]